MLKVIIIFLFRLLLLANALTKSINLKVINLLRRILYKINAVRKPKFCLTLTSEFSVNLCISLQTKGLPRQLYWYIDFRYNTAIARLFLKKVFTEDPGSKSMHLHKKLRNRLQQLEKFEQKGCTVLDMRGLALNASFIFLNKRIPSSLSY